MKSVHPDDGAAPRELVVVVSGRSIELNALAQRLAAAGAVVAPLASGAAEGAPLAADLVVCDLASDQALALLEQPWQATPEPRPVLVLLGSPRQPLPDSLASLLGAARRRYPRPLDIQLISDELLGALQQPKPSARPPQSGDLSHGPGERRSNRPSRVSAPAAASAAPGEPSLPPAGGHGAPEDLPAGSQRLGAPALEHSVMSPELETLLAEAERRVQAQVSMHQEPAASTPPNGVNARLTDDVWDALGEPLDDDPENAGGDPVSDEVHPPPSPLGPDLGSRSPSSPADSTVPPELWRDPIDEDTGSHVHIAESEQTSGSQSPITAAGHAAIPPTLGPTRDVLLRDDGGELRGRDSQPTQPPSTSPPARPRADERRPTPNPTPPRISDVPDSIESQLPGTLGPEELGTAAALDAAGAPDGGAPPEAAEAPRPSSPLELPGALVRGAPASVMGRAVRQRFSGCLAFEVDQGLRRIVFKDGDVVISVSAVHGESLAAFLAQRGDLTPETAAQIEHRIPAFGRHAGAALIARGLLQQNDLWPVLRAHAEWVLAQLLLIERGSVHLEHPLPERLAAEPAVFGGATGAEVLVEVIQRVVPPPQALAFLGSTALVFAPGPAFHLLAECALSPRLVELVRRAEQVDLESLLREAVDEPMLPCVLYALSVLLVLQPAQPVQHRAPRSSRSGPARVPDTIDDDALRARVQARRALVDDGDYFAVLGVPRAATGYDIRRSYVELRRQFDPRLVLRVGTLDLQDDVDTILEVLDEAYEILRDQQRRERYRRAIESTP
jgi:DnaJ-like protein/uncharacterized protein DUF4388